MSGCCGTQSFPNPRKLKVSGFSIWALANPTALKNSAKYFTDEMISQELLHESLTALKEGGEMDLLMWKRLMHMTRNCNGSPNRLYYRLKNVFGTQKAGIVDKIKFRVKDPNLDKTVTDFLDFCKEFKRLGFEAEDYEANKGR